jgi:hypothetical protein
MNLPCVSNLACLAPRKSCTRIGRVFIRICMAEEIDCVDWLILKRLQLLGLILFVSQLVKTI